MTTATGVLTDHGNVLKLLLHDDLEVLCAGRVRGLERGRGEKEDVQLCRAVVHDDEAGLVGADRVARDGGIHHRHEVEQALAEMVHHFINNICTTYYNQGRGQEAT